MAMTLKQDSFFKTIAIHTWEPGLESVGGLTASSGGASWLRFLIDKLLSFGHKVIWISNDPTVKVEGCDVISVTDMCNRYTEMADTLFMPWRWEMPNYPERNKLYLEQFELASKLGGRLIIHDEDHMMTNEDKFAMRNFGAIMTTPAIFPPAGFESLHFPYTFDDAPIFHKELKDCQYEIAYVGNNYGRFDQTCKFLNINADAFQVEFWGNWLDDAPGRESPEEVVANLPHAFFNGRIPNHLVRSVLSNSYATIHLCKDSYAERGFITMRWAEAASVGTIGFIPAMFKLPRTWYNRFSKLGLIVNSAGDVVKRMNEFVSTPGKYEEAITVQREFVHQVMHQEDWNILVS